MRLFFAISLQLVREQIEYTIPFAVYRDVNVLLKNHFILFLISSVFGISSITIIFDFIFTPVLGVSADWLLDPPKRPPIIGGVALYSGLCSLHCTILTNFNLYVS